MNISLENKQFRQNSLSVCLLGIGIACFIGCGAATDPEPVTADVKVTVTFDGKPVTKGSVNLIMVGTAQSGSGDLNDEGIATIQDVVVGSYAVLVLPPSPPAPDPNAPPAPPEVFADIPQKFRGETTSPLTADVKEGDNAFTFDLK